MSAETEALRVIAEKQPEALAIIRRNGFVFKRGNIGNTPGRWDHLAFTLYSLICEIDNIAQSGLHAGDRECDHKWRDYGDPIGWACRDCGTPQPKEQA